MVWINVPIPTVHDESSIHKNNEILIGDLVCTRLTISPEDSLVLGSQEGEWSTCTCTVDKALDRSWNLKVEWQKLFAPFVSFYIFGKNQEKIHKNYILYLKIFLKIFGKNQETFMIQIGQKCSFAWISSFHLQIPTHRLEEEPECFHFENQIIVFLF